MNQSEDLGRGYDEPCWVCGASRNYFHEKSDPLNVAISELVKKFKEMKCPTGVELCIKGVVIRWEKKSALKGDPRWTITLNDKFYWDASLQQKLILVNNLTTLHTAIVNAKEAFIPMLDKALETIKTYLNQ